MGKLSAFFWAPLDCLVLEECRSLWAGMCLVNSSRALLKAWDGDPSDLLASKLPLEAADSTWPPQMRFKWDMEVPWSRLDPFKADGAWTCFCCRRGFRHLRLENRCWHLGKALSDSQKQSFVVILWNISYNQAKLSGKTCLRWNYTKMVCCFLHISNTFQSEIFTSKSTFKIGAHFSNEPMMHIITHNSDKLVHTCNNRVGHRAKLIQAKQEIPKWTGGRRCGRQWCPSGLDETDLSLVFKYKAWSAFVCIFLCLSQGTSVYIVACTSVIAFEYVTCWRTESCNPVAKLGGSEVPRELRSLSSDKSCSVSYP